MVAADFMHELAASPAGTLEYINFDARLVVIGANFMPEIFDVIGTSNWLKVEYKRNENEDS